MSEKNKILLLSADKLAKETNALAVISFLPKEPDLVLETPVVHIHDVHPEILKDQSMLSLVDYCSTQIMDAVLQYRIITKATGGLVVAVFPNAVLIYDIESADSEFSPRDFAEIADPDAIHALLSIALEIAHDGREGRSVGTAFIIGDIDDLKRWSHQGVLNPYEGHPESVRDVKIKENWESVKEFSQLDGVFIIDKNGIIGASGRYLDADGRDVRLQSGLGGRHLAAAAITKVTRSIGIVISESGGVIRIFVNGKVEAHIRTDMTLEL